jgi:hypothetical protein
MRLQGFDSRLLHLLPDTEIEGVEWLSEPGLLRYAEILAARRGCTRAQT